MTCMAMIDPATDWFDIVEIPTHDLDEVTGVNGEYIYKSYARISQLFNKTWLYRYPRPRKVVFDNRSEFKRNLAPFLKYFNINPVLTTIKNPVERVHQVILNMLVTKDLDNKVFQCIDPLGETLASIAWDIRASYYRTIRATPGQAVFGKYMIFNLTSVVDWKVATATKQRQLDIDNAQENYRQVTD